MRSRGSGTALASGSVIIHPATPFSGLWFAPSISARCSYVNIVSPGTHPVKRSRRVSANSPGAAGRLSSLSLWGSRETVRGPCLSVVGCCRQLESSADLWLPNSGSVAAEASGCSSPSRCGRAAMKKPARWVASSGQRLERGVNAPRGNRPARSRRPAGSGLPARAQGHSRCASAT